MFAEKTTRQISIIRSIGKFRYTFNKKSCIKGVKCKHKQGSEVQKHLQIRLSIQKLCRLINRNVEINPQVNSGCLQIFFLFFVHQTSISLFRENFFPAFCAFIMVVKFHMDFLSNKN